MSKRSDVVSCPIASEWIYKIVKIICAHVVLLHFFSALHCVYLFVHHTGVHKRAHNTCTFTEYGCTQYMWMHPCTTCMCMKIRTCTLILLMIWIEWRGFLSMKVDRNLYLQQRVSSEMQSLWMTVNLKLVMLSKLKCLGVKWEVWKKLVTDYLYATIWRVLYCL